MTIVDDEGNPKWVWVLLFVMILSICCIAGASQIKQVRNTCISCCECSYTFVKCLCYPIRFCLSACWNSCHIPDQGGEESSSMIQII